MTFLSSWGQVATAAAATAVVYAVALTAIRLAGRRTLAEMSAFDVVVTVAIGTVVGSTSLPSNPAVVDGAAVLATLLLLQVSVAAIRQRFPRARRYLDFRPYVIARDGEVTLRRSPLTAQLTEDDVRSKLRTQGVFSLDEVDTAILEPTGKISVIPPGTTASRDMVDGILDG